MTGIDFHASHVTLLRVSLFADRTQEWLNYRGWTVYRLGKVMGSPHKQDQIRRWMSGEYEPRAKNIRAVAMALGVTEEEFWAGPSKLRAVEGGGAVRTPAHPPESARSIPAVHPQDRRSAPDRRARG